MATTATPFIDALRQYRLLDSQQLSELSRKIQPKFREPKALGRELLRRGWLTPYQVNQLLQERGQELLLGSYVLLERLGEGGMGQVFKARNWKLGQIVALKVIQPDRLANPNAVKRFQREIRAAASLSHPNIVHALDADHVGSTHMLVMEYVEGTDLSQLVKQSGPVSVRKACEYIRQAALGLQHAHEQGLVHRDIKPSNLLLASQGSVVKILDFGLARLAEGAPGETATCLTQSGLVVGTPDYMAPEQVRDPHSADVRADLYSLGCSLYYLLSGLAPFPDGSATEKVLKHMQEEPRPIEQLRPDLAGEVVAVLRKLMAKRPEDRYQTPAELAAALQAVLSSGRASKVKTADAPASRGRATVALARSPGARGRWRVAVFALLVLLAGAAIAWPLLPRPKAPSTKASRAERKELPQPAIPAEKEPVKATVVERKEPPPVLPPPMETKVRPPEKRPVLPDQEQTVILGEPKEKSRGAVYALAISADGRLMASGGADDTIRLWDTGSWKERSMSLRGHAGDIRALAFRSDGALLASASDDETVKLWDVASGREIASFPGHTGGTRAVAFSPDGRTLASGAARDPSLKLWDVAGQKEKATWKAHDGGVLSLSFAPDGLTLASGGGDNLIRVWDLATNAEQVVLKGHSGGIISLAHAADGKRLASGTRAGALRLWAPPAKDSRRFNAPKGGLSALAFSPDNQRLVSSDGKNILILWDVESGGRLTERPFSLPVHSLAFSPNGHFLAAGTDAGTIHIIRPDLQAARLSP